MTSLEVDATELSSTEQDGRPDSARSHEERSQHSRTKRAAARHTPSKDSAMGEGRGQHMKASQSASSLSNASAGECTLHCLHNL